MTKKKSFLTLLLVFCLILPAMLILPACGKVETTINSKQFVNALSFQDKNGDYYKNFKRIAKNKGGKVVGELIVTENIVYQLKVNANTGDKTYIYYTNEDGKGVTYTAVNDGKFVRATRTARFDVGELISDNNTFLEYASDPYGYENFEYKKEDKKYHDTVTDDNFIIKLQFENKKLVNVYLGVLLTPTETGTTWTISYGDAELTIPSGDQLAE